MSTLVVLKFPSETGAHQMRDRLLALQKQNIIAIQDAAIITRRANGKPKLEQLHNLAGAGAMGGAFWGMLVGLLFFVPVLGLAVGAAAGALSGAFRDIGIDDTFIKTVGNTIQPGDSALFLLVDSATIDRVAEQTHDITYEVLQTNLSKESEEQLRVELGV